MDIRNLCHPAWWYLPDSLPPKNEAKTRIKGWQLDVLKEEYRRDKFPDTPHKQKLASKLGMTFRKVQIWFQNRRAREKRKFRQNVFCKFSSYKPRDGSFSCVN